MKTLKWQFGIGAMLFGISCIAGILAGYRYGGDVKDKQIAASTITVVNYDVREFLNDENPQPLDAQLTRICDLMVETIEPGTWQSDERDAVPYPTNASIVVRQTGSCHAAIANLLDQMRTLKTQITKR